MVRRLLSFIVLWLAATSAVAAQTIPTILVVGDSLSAGYGLATGQGWVTLLQQRLAHEAYPHKVVNASVSGDTTSGALARLPAALDQHKPQIVLIELGGNDGLRALPLKNLRDNLAAMIGLSRKAGAQPLLFEMRIPPNYGPVYANGFRDAFHEVAKAGKVPLVPFFLMGIVDKPGTFQDDGIHPSAAAQAQMLEAVWPSLKPLLRQD
jgi:acyl-CoA thioesterase-1